MELLSTQAATWLSRAPRSGAYCPRADARSLSFLCLRRAGIGSDQRLDLVGGEDSEERGLRVGRVSAKSPTSRKEREKWGTRLREAISALRMTEGIWVEAFLHYRPVMPLSAA